MNGMYEELIEKLRKNNRMSGWTHIDRLIDEAAEAIEALQEENNGWRERYDELDAGHSRLFKDFCKLQQENERLADETIKLMKENAKNSNKKDELVKALKQARDAINGYSTCPYCWGVNGHAKGCKFYEALQNIDALYEDSGLSPEQVQELAKAKAEGRLVVLPTCNVTKLPCTGCNPCCEHREE